MKKFLKINLLKAELYAEAVFIVLKGKHFKDLALLSHRKKVQVSHPVVVMHLHSICNHVLPT